MSLAEASFDGWREDKGAHTRRRTTAYVEDVARPAGDKARREGSDRDDRK